MVLEEALRGLECGRPQLHLSVVIHPYFQPTPHGVGLGSAVVDACIFLDGFLQFLLDFCLRLAEDTLDDGFPSFWIAALFFVYCAAIFAPPGGRLYLVTAVQFWNSGEALFIRYSSVEYVRFTLKIALTWKVLS